MNMLNRIQAFRPDSFTFAILAVVGLASVLPAHGLAAEVLSYVVKIAIAVLFFLYGARLPRELVIANIAHWRLHLTITLVTFALFPAIALTSAVLVPDILSPDLYTGIVFLAVLPSTVQASIVFTSLAGGNVPAAICSASLSNLLGVVLTPALVALLLHANGASVSLDAIEAILLQVLLPFLVGQLLRPWLSAWADRRKALLSRIDRGSVLIMIYNAFSAAVVGGLWTRLGLADFAAVIATDMALLALVLGSTMMLARRLGFSRADEIAIVFCGSKKSMVVGLPMANVLFAGQAVGDIVIPVLIYHQLQTIACAILARRYAAQAEALPAAGRAEAAA